MHLQALAECFNLLNHTNVIALNGNFGAGAYPANPAPGFRQIVAVNDPRQLQLGLRASF